MSLKALFLLPILVLLFVCFGAVHPNAVAAQTETVKDGTPRYVTTKLIPEFAAAIPGQPLTVAIDQTMIDGWHTYWKNPGDSGEATSIEWTLPDGWTAGPISFPTPEKLPTGPLMNYGYDHHVTLLTTLNVPATVTTDSVTLSATITWLVCADICVPETTTATLALPISKDGHTPEATDAALFDAARKAMPENVAWQGMIEEQDQNLLLRFQMDADVIAELSSATYMYFYPEDWGLILYASPQHIAIENDRLVIHAPRDTRPLTDLTSIKGIFAYTAKDGAHKSVQIDVPVMGKAPAIATTTAPPVNTAPTTFPQALFLAFLGGIILNLMPCVFPILSMKALSLIKMSEREQKHASLHGIIYTVGILVCFLAIAGLLIALQAAGDQIGWGFQLQNPAVILALAYLLFVLGLNMSGFFEFRSHILSNIGHKLTAKHGYVGTFFTGMLATIVATPCTAPFMGTAMGYALTQPPMVSLSVFIALGLGLAVPYLLLCLVPPLRRALPKPGAWMQTFRQFMAFPLYASVVWLIWVYAQQVNNSDAFLLGMGGLVLIAFSVWASWHTPARQPLKNLVRSLSFLSVLAAIFIVGMSASQKPDSNAEPAHIVSFPYTPFTKADFDKAVSGNDPIFVDMTAAWCITCKVNEKVALSTDSTQALFRSKNVQVMVGDWTNKSIEITEFLRSYSRSGVPLYVYIGARDTATGTRPEAKILPQLLTSGIIADAINNP